MKFKAEIKMDNAAFEDSEELSRILKKIAKEVTEQKKRFVNDYNGNLVGSWEIVE